MPKYSVNFNGSLGILVILQNCSLYNNLRMYLSCTKRENNSGFFVKELVSEGLLTMFFCPHEFREH